jgi:hypothetical protein
MTQRKFIPCAWLMGLLMAHDQGTIQFTDSSAANSDSRFYRVVSP